MAVVNPAVQPADEAVDGDNLTVAQASLILAVFNANPDEVLEEAEELEMSEDDVDSLLTMLADMAGTTEEDAAETEEGEADPNEMEAL